MAQDNKIVKLDQRLKNQTQSLSQLDEITLRTTKEIVIKFIEMGRCSPATFEDVFTQVYRVVKGTLLKD